MTKQQSDSVEMLKAREFRVISDNQGVVTLVRSGVRASLYATVGPSGKVNGDNLKKFLKRLKYWLRKQDRKAIAQ